jgi:hypothetical protein
MQLGDALRLAAKTATPLLGPSVRYNAQPPALKSRPCAVHPLVWFADELKVPLSPLVGSQ